MKRFLRSLRTRLIVSHVLPVLVVIPVVGFALTYLLETQVLLAGLSSELERQALLVATVAADYPHIWFDPQRAQAFTGRLGPQVAARVMLLEPDGTLLASTDPADASAVGQRLDVPGLSYVLVSRRVLRVDYGRQPGTGAAEVLVPVTINGHIVGVIRLTDPLSSLYERFPRTRVLVTSILAGGLLLGLAIGWYLAVDLERPLRRATQSISHMAGGGALAPLPEQGPEEIRLLLRAFNSLTEQRRNLERARQRLLANLVHELGRPLGALLSATQALEAGADADPALREELLGGMESEVRRMRHLLDDLTGLYDQGEGPLKLDRKPVALGPWLAQVLGPWREEARQQGLRWRADLDELPVVPIDPERLSQAVGNVLSNAIKYTPPGGEVAVEAAVEGGEVCIGVRDSGPGIPPEEWEHIFTPFYRGSAGQRFPSGMGLGLGIARDVVAAHDGRIDVQSAPSRGAAFVLRIPIAPHPSANR